MKLIYSNLIEIFITEFPDICKIKEKEIQSLSWEISKNLVYSFYEEIVRSYFVYLLENEYKNNSIEEGSEKILRVRLIEFFEKMARSDDVNVRDVLQIAIFEFITDNTEILQFLPQLLGKESKNIFIQSYNIEI